MTPLRNKQVSFLRSKSIGVEGTPAPAKRTVPALTEAQAAFYGGLGKSSAFSLAAKSKILLTGKKIVRHV